MAAAHTAPAAPADPLLLGPRHFLIGALQAVLAAQRRFGTTRQIAGGLPDHTGNFGRDALARTLANLDIPHRLEPVTIGALCDGPLPCLVLDQSDQVFWVEDCHEDLGLKTRSTARPTARWVGLPSGPLRRLSLHPDAADADPAAGATGAAGLLDIVRPEIAPLLVNSSIINLLGLATPFFVMAIYNTALPSQSVAVLASLGLGLLLIYLFEFAIRWVRTNSLQQSSAALERGLAQGLLGKLFALPMPYLTRKDSASYSAYLRQFKAIKTMLQGPVVQSILDLPFVVLFAAVLFALAPPIGWTVLCFAGLTAALFLALRPQRKAREARSQAAQADYQRLLTEAVERQSDIRRLGLTCIWRRRLDASLDTMIAASYASQRFNQMVSLLLQSLVMTAGIFSGFRATDLAIRGELSVGALIAILVLTWRFLTPIQSLSNASEQGLFALGSLASFRSLLALPGEPVRGVARFPAAPLEPSIQFEQVSVRFKDAVSPALLGVNLQAQAGDILVVCGGAMSGKTCLAETLAGLYTPVSGRVLVGGVDIATYPRDALREQVVLCPQEPQLIGLSLRDNFLLANPRLTEPEIWEVLRQIGADSLVQALPDGLDCTMTPPQVARLPQTQLRAIAVAIGLAQAGPIYIFDQPTRGLPDAMASAVRAALREKARDGLVVLITNDAAEMALASRLVMLDRGRVVINERGARGRDKALTLLSPGRAA